ncbi:MAG TPA: protein-export chaperone SecB [Thermomicrobiales bacterium]|nr:protein-export chaperone SecB [Thermomicrobiales bacterium]
MKQVWLQSLTFENLLGPGQPDESDVSLQFRSKYFETEGDLIATTQYQVAFSGVGEEEYLRAELELSARFSIEGDLNEQFMAHFANTSLQLILWPYLRQTVHDLVGRTGWSAFAIPPFKVGLV